MYARMVGRLIAFAAFVAICPAANATCSADAVASADAGRWTSGQLSTGKATMLATLARMRCTDVHLTMGADTHVVATIRSANGFELRRDGSDARIGYVASADLVFNDLREGSFDVAEARVDGMEALVEAHGMGEDEWLAWGMKRMLLRSMLGDADGVDGMLAAVDRRIPRNTEHMRIFRYNRALALFKLGDASVAVSEASNLIREYYADLGIEPEDVLGRNAPELRPLLPRDRDLTDTLKHLADTLDLMAQATGRTGLRSAMARIHAMKFYELAHAFDSLVRVGLDLVDEFVSVNDFVGARQVLERNLFPIMQGVGLASRVLETRALYAVVLAYCGDHDAAANEVARLEPFEEAMGPEHRRAFGGQKRLIEGLRRFGGPRQRQVDIPAPIQALFDQRRGAPRAVEPRRKVGRNERCPCGSERKFKLCHGR